MEERKCCYAGSFAPFHKGHDHVLRKSLEMFDTVYLLFARNPEKSNNPVDRMFVQASMDAVREMYHTEIVNGKLIICSLGEKELTAVFCKQYGIRYLVRGIRGTTDYGEIMLADVNNQISDGYTDTILIPSPSSLSTLSSSLVRQIWGMEGIKFELFNKMLPKEVIDNLLDEEIRNGIGK